MSESIPGPDTSSTVFSHGIGRQSNCDVNLQEVRQGNNDVRILLFFFAYLLIRSFNPRRLNHGTLLLI